MADRGRTTRSTVDAALRIGAALAGTAPPALFAAIGLARFLPLGEEARFVAGIALAVPLWVTGICLAFLARGGGRAWLWCGGLALALGGLAFGVPR